MTLYLHNENVDGPGEWTESELEDATWWNCWQVRMWPYIHIEDTDEILLVESWRGGSEVAWHCQLRDLLKERYESKQQLHTTLAKHFGLSTAEVSSNDYTARAPAQGWVLGFGVRDVKRVGAPRPEGLRLRRNGWQSADHIDPDTLRRWGVKP